MKDSKSKNSLIYTLAPFLVGLFVFGYLYFFFPKFNAEESLTREIQKLVSIHYLDDVAVENKQDTETINQWLHKLDPHTTYLGPKKAVHSKNELEGVLVGIGVQLIYHSDTPVVIFVLPNSPAARGGVIPGDQIIAVNDVGIQEISKSDTSVTERVMGKENTEVSISFYNLHFNSVKVRKLTRASIPFSSTSNIFLTNDKIGYAKFNIFSIGSHDELVDSLESLKKQGMQSLVLDLRNNGGGVLGEAVSIANEFLAKNDLITFTKGKEREEQRYEANGKGKFLDLPITILINNNSASASEVLTAALQENNRAKSVGSHSYGKGLVQETFFLSNKGSLNITVARYYTPKGNSIQRTYPYTTKDTLYGVQPSLNVETNFDLYPAREHFDWATNNAMFLKNWKELYPSSTAFANRYCEASDSLLYYVALGLVTYGPNELPNFILRKDPVYKAATTLLR